MKQLVSCQVSVCANELLATAAKAAIRAIDIDASSLRLQFSPPIDVQEVTYVFAVAQARLERDGLETLLKEGVLGCGITVVPSNRYDPLKPFDLTW